MNSYLLMYVFKNDLNIIITIILRRIFFLKEFWLLIVVVKYVE